MVQAARGPGTATWSRPSRCERGQARSSIESSAFRFMAFARTIWHPRAAGARCMVPARCQPPPQWEACWPKILKTSKRTVTPRRPARSTGPPGSHLPAAARLAPTAVSAAGLDQDLPAEVLKAGLVLDQGEEGACTGFGLAAVVNYLLPPVVLAKTPPRRPWLARGCSITSREVYDEWPGEDYDGSSCRGALKAWHKHGVCSDDMWPYRDQAGHVRFLKPARPVERGRADPAARRLLPRQSRVGRRHAGGDSRDRRDLRVGRRARRLGHRVRNEAHHRPCLVAGGKPMRKADSLGGHAFALVGYNGLGFVVQNSWGCAGAIAASAGCRTRSGSTASAWIAALGVPSGAARTSTCARAREQAGDRARRSQSRFSAPSRPTEPPPKVRKEVASWIEQAVSAHDRDGQRRAVINRITHENGASLPCATSSAMRRCASGKAARNRGASRSTRTAA